MKKPDDDEDEFEADDLQDDDVEIDDDGISL